MLDLNSEASKVHAKNLINFHDQILQSTLQTGTYKKLYSFNHIVNGFAVHTTPSKAKQLRNAPGVILVEKDRGTKLMTTYTPRFLNLPKVWAQQGGDKKAGDGIVIGVVDTGINPSHPSFAYDPSNPFTSDISHFSGACETGPNFPSTSCNGKIVSARFFSAGAKAMGFLNKSVDIFSPFDTVGHGSHVASIAAGNAEVPVVVNGISYGKASGMAPRARIAVYKAIYSKVGALVDVVAAIDQATKDGVDIISLSIGAEEPPEDTPTVLCSFSIILLFSRRCGVFVVHAAGNQGPTPSTVLSHGPWVITAASGTTDRRYHVSLLLGNGEEVKGVGLSGPNSGTGLRLNKLVLAKDALKLNDSFPMTAEYVEECQHPEAFDPTLVQDSLVICTFSAGFYNETSTILAIIDTAKALRFKGFLLVANPIYGDFSAGPTPFDVPGLLVPKVVDAQIILRYYKQQTLTNSSAQAAIGEGRIASFTGRAPVVSRFSSRGPNFIDKKKNLVDVLKPDVLTPGHQIWAAWALTSVSEPILAGHDFALFSGTSMATPHLAGIAALIKQRNPSWSPSMIQSAITTTATKYDNNGELIMAEAEDFSLYPSTHFDFGAGHVSAERAVDPGLVLSAEFKDYISFLCSLPNVSRSTIRIATGALCNHSLSHPANLNLPSVTISELKGSLKVRRSFMNVASKAETYLCSVIAPNGTAVSLYPPWFTVASLGTQDLDIQFNVTQSWNEFSFGEIVLTGSLYHIVRIPLSVKPVSI